MGFENGLVRGTARFQTSAAVVGKKVVADPMELTVVMGLKVARLAVVGPISVGRVAWARNTGRSWLVAVVVVVVVAVGGVVLRAGFGVVQLVM